MAISLRMARSSNNRGLTFVEVIVSVLLLAIIGAGTFAAFSTVQYAFAFRKHRIEAYNCAREILDRLKANYGYDGTLYPDMAVGTHDIADIGGGVTVSGELAPLITQYEYTVTEPEVNGYKKVEVTLEWNE